MADDQQNLELTIALGSSSQPAVFRRDLDMNKMPEAENDQEELRSAGSTAVFDGELEEVIAENGHHPKKLRLAKEQIKLLEESFRQSHNLNPRRKEELAKALKLKARQIEVWFQNRRARTKLKQTEMEFEYLKRCYGSLTEENRRLQMEVRQLKAVKVAPLSVLPLSSRRPLPPSSFFVMCPCCECVTAAGPSIGGGRSFYRQQ